MVHSTENQPQFPKVTESTERQPGPVLESGEATDVVFTVTTEQEDGRKGTFRILSSAFVSQKP
jgi:hypothetical protein